MAILSLGLDKLVRPLYVVYYTKFMVMALQKAGGFHYEEARARVAALSDQAVEQFVADPMCVLRAPSKMMQILGKDTVYGIIGFQIFRRVSMFKSKDQVVALLLRKGELGMEELTDFFRDPVAAAQKILQQSEWETSSHRSTPLLEVDPKINAVEDDEHSFGVMEDKVEPTCAVFGLFPSTRLKDIRAGIVPVIFFTLYSNWDLVTRRFFYLVNQHGDLHRAGRAGPCEADHPLDGRRPVDRPGGRPPCCGHHRLLRPRLLFPRLPGVHLPPHEDKR